MDLPWLGGLKLMTLLPPSRRRGTMKLPGPARERSIESYDRFAPFSRTGTSAPMRSRSSAWNQPRRVGFTSDDRLRGTQHDVAPTVGLRELERLLTRARDGRVMLHRPLRALLEHKLPAACLLEAPIRAQIGRLLSAGGCGEEQKRGRCPQCSCHIDHPRGAVLGGSAVYTVPRPRVFPSGPAGGASAGGANCNTGAIHARRAGLAADLHAGRNHADDRSERCSPLPA